jgi:hypothetical protein
MVRFFFVIFVSFVVKIGLRLAAPGHCPMENDGLEPKQSRLLGGEAKVSLHFRICIPSKTCYGRICEALTRLFFEIAMSGQGPPAFAKASAVAEAMADRVDWQAEPEVERFSAYLRLLRILAAIPLSKYRLVSPSIGW